MDPALYKSATTRRSLKYNYYFSSPVAGKPILLFVHGFPSTSYDWRHQVEFFKTQGYGLIVPDMLGYGGTDKPADYTEYRMSLMTQDVVDILDAEKVEKVIAIGHDWGCGVVSRLANYFPDRFTAFAFLAVGYVPPGNTKFADFQAQTRARIGYDPFGYWNFFAEEGSPKLIEDNFDSFYSLVLADDPKIWLTDFAPTGALKAWVEAKKTTKIASYLSQQELDKQKEELLKGGFLGPTNWYRVRVFDLDLEDGKKIRPESVLLYKPVFIGTALQDPICLPAVAKAVAAQCVKGPLTVRDFDTGHWVLWQEKDKLNEEILAWVQGL